jgi:hypothetical protein
MMRGGVGHGGGLCQLVKATATASGLLSVRGQTGAFMHSTGQNGQSALFL